MFKAHCLQKTWHAVSMKCNVSLDELEKAAQAPEKIEVELQKDVVRRHWRSYSIRYAIWHIHDAWKEVMESCIHGAWKKLCPEFTVDFRGFDQSKSLSEERLKCLDLARKVSLEIQEEDSDSLLEDLNKLENQRHQLEEEVEAEQHPTAPSTTKQLIVKILQRFFGIINQGMDYLQEVDPDVERT